MMRTVTRDYLPLWRERELYLAEQPENNRIGFYAEDLVPGLIRVNGQRIVAVTRKSRGRVQVTMTQLRHTRRRWSWSRRGGLDRETLGPDQGMAVLLSSARERCPAGSGGAWCP